MNTWPSHHKPGHVALRRGRVSIPGCIYLITATTKQRRPLFLDSDLGNLASASIAAASHWPDARLLAWVLMPDHLHMLIELGAKESLALVVQRIKSVSAAAVNRHPGREGPLWQRAFHDHALREDEDVLVAARYVVANPIRAGLVADIRDYPYWDAIWLDERNHPLVP